MSDVIPRERPPAGRGMYGWFQDRLNIEAIWQALFIRKIPFGVNLLYTLGFACIARFVVQDAAAFEVREGRGVLQEGAARSNAARQQTLQAFNDGFMTPLTTAAQSGDRTHYEAAYRATIGGCNRDTPVSRTARPGSPSLLSSGSTRASRVA